MKLIYKTSLIALCVLTMSCSRKEDELIARDGSTTNKFEFPENTPNDALTSDIYNEFGVQIIYKGVTSNSINYSWTGPQNKRFTLLDDSKARRDIEFVNNNIFKKITNAQLVKKILKPYLYLVYDCNQPGAIYGYYIPLKYDFEGIDNWSLCFEGRGADTYPTPGVSLIKFPTNEADIKIERGTIFYNIFKSLVEKKHIEIPSQFRNDFDYKTAINTNLTANENYFMRRGFLGYAASLTFTFTVSSYTIAKESPTKTFINYMTFIAKYSKDELVNKSITLSGGKYKDYEKVMKYYDFVDKYLIENYNLDLKLLHTL